MISGISGLGPRSRDWNPWSVNAARRNHDQVTKCLSGVKSSPARIPVGRRLLWSAALTVKLNREELGLISTKSYTAAYEWFTSLHPNYRFFFKQATPWGLFDLSNRKDIRLGSTQIYTTHPIRLTMWVTLCTYMRHPKRTEQWDFLTGAALLQDACTLTVHSSLG